ncbi:hypothetical protein BO71DRAFT_341857 [Aspergillus ellipticus CBS 707.79]|uniref:Chromo domain-containing protein n=1 Tax=Aspergillus ellipticus CBS 707.79 TaxID=1448320 RepID=A0A319DQV5_9EURO|nr:hypothetical protein BO71DRAFT_341857 [Aspergillus ellipticus CBS 707.79]
MPWAPHLRRRSHRLLLPLDPAMTKNHDDNDDDISVTSTVASSQASEYEVEAILAEKQFPDGIKYLVKWANYPETRCSWEPTTSFNSDESISGWEQTKADIASGKREGFNVARWDRMMQKIEEDRKKRKHKREVKRKRLGISTTETIELAVKRSSTKSDDPSGQSRNDASKVIAQTSMSNSRPQPLRQAAPTKMPVVSRPPLVSFGSGQKPSTTARPKNTQESTKWFPHLSTSWKHEKARSREPAPDISQLDLTRPSDWPPRTPLFPQPKPGSYISPYRDEGLNRSVIDTSAPEDSANLSATIGHSQSTVLASNREDYGHSHRRDELGRGHNSDLRHPRTKSASRHVRPSSDGEPSQNSQQSLFDRAFSHMETDTPREKVHLHTPHRLRQSTMSESSSTSHSRPTWASESRQDSIIPNLPLREAGPLAKTVHGRFCNPGEVLIHMYYGPDKKMIGAARLCGLGLVTIQKLVQSKNGPWIEIWFQHLCTFEKYQALCDNLLRKKPHLPTVVNRIFCKGWIEGFNDTEADVHNVAKELEQGNLMAIFNPGLATQNVLIAYSPHSPEFRSLSQGFQGQSDASLLLVVRNSLGPLEQLMSKTTDQVSTSHEPEICARERPGQHQADDEEDTSMTVSHVDQEEMSSREDPPVRPTEMTKYFSTQESSLVPLDDTVLASQDDTDPLKNNHQEPREPMEMNQRQFLGPALSEQQLISALATADLKVLFKHSFGVSYEVLVNVNAVDRVQVAEAFFLMFPQGSGALHQEFLTLQAFLKTRNPVIYSCYQQDDWEKFARTVTVGVVLFHESFVDFHTLPFFKSLIDKQFNFWSVSLNRPLEYADHPCHFQRIFPHGGVLMITEDFMVLEPESVIIILTWFHDWIKRKFPGKWKIMFRPGVLDWVLQQPEPADESRAGIWLTIYRLILQLCTPSAYDTPIGEVLTGSTDEYIESNVISPPTLPNYGSRKEDDSPDIPKGLSQDQRNTDHLIEFFAGWGLVNRHRYRRFVVLTRTKPQPRWEAWQHIEIKWGAKDFMKTFKVDYKHYWAKLASSSTDKSSSTSGEPNVQPATFTPPTPRAPAPGAPGFKEVKGPRFDRLPGSAPSTYPEPYK